MTQEVHSRTKALVTNFAATAVREGLFWTVSPETAAEHILDVSFSDTPEGGVSATLVIDPKDVPPEYFPAEFPPFGDFQTGGITLIPTPTEILSLER